MFSLIKRFNALVPKRKKRNILQWKFSSGVSFFGYLLEVLLRHSPSSHSFKSWGLSVKPNACFLSGKFSTKNLHN